MNPVSTFPIEYRPGMSIFYYRISSHSTAFSVEWGSIFYGGPYPIWLIEYGLPLKMDLGSIIYRGPYLWESIFDMYYMGPTEKGPRI